MQSLSVKAGKEDRSYDLTLNKQWQEEQFDRLLAFEYLRKFATGEPGEINPGVMADKLGADKGFIHLMTKAIRGRLN